MTIDTKELRQLAQAATPGPWRNYGRQPNVAGLPHSAVAAKTLLARVYSEAYGDVAQETANAAFIAAANPAAISELLDRLEEAEKERDALLEAHCPRHRRAAMTPAEVAAKLRQFNEWRRGDYEPSEQPEPLNPYEVGLAIDAAVELLDRLEAAEGKLETERMRLAVCSVAGTQAQPAPSVPDGWLRVIDEALVVTHLGVANADDSYEAAKRKLNELIGWHTDVATDPAVNGGFKLVPADAQPAPSVPDCGEAGHDEGRCGNKQCINNAKRRGK